MRPAKYIRLNFVDRQAKAFIAVFGNPDEVRIAANPTTFLAVRADGVTLSPGLGNKISIQSMPGMLYGGVLQDLPFPLTLLPSTMATPLPQQTFAPPMQDLLPTIRTISMIATSFVGV